MARIVAIANQKGGVGKTTTAVNLAASLAIAERRTLLVDADPQGNATSGVGVDKTSLRASLYEVILGAAHVNDAVLHNTGLPHLDVVPATQDLVGAELELIDRVGREAMLRRALEPVREAYDYILVDCPPSLGLITLNVLAAADGVIIPIQCEYYALEGISQLLNTVRLVQQNFNEKLALDGVLLTMYDSRLNLCRQVAEDAKEYFGAQMFRAAVPRNVRLAEAPSFGKPILMYDVQSVGAKSYLAIAQELMQRSEPAATSDDAAAAASGDAVAATSDAPSEDTDASEPGTDEPRSPTSEDRAASTADDGAATVAEAAETSSMNEPVAAETDETVSDTEAEAASEATP